MSERVKKVYSFYAHTYDSFFGKILEHGRYVAFNMMNVKPNEKILEVGVGTGLSLPLYPKEVDITGIDISQEMLDKAEAKKQYYGLSNINLYNMDASSMNFPDNVFVSASTSAALALPSSTTSRPPVIPRPSLKGGEIFI